MKKMLKSVYASLKPKWPRPKFDGADQPHFFFLLTPPNSGSTAIAKFLDSSPRTMTLTPNGEGQWLVPGLCAKDRWNPEKKIDFDSVKSVWLKAYQDAKASNPEVDVVIEKSPPNMMRIKELSTLFSSVSLLANNRDPYANCSSRLFRYHDEEDIRSSSRETILRNLASSWVQRSQRIRDIVEENDIPVLTYERFCETPALLLDMLSFPEGVTDSVSLDAQVKVKDYQLQSIVNQNERQIADLADTDIDCLNEILKPETELLEFFGYRLL